MCSGVDVLSRTKNGVVFKCKGCNTFQILYNNLNFSFTDDEYSNFTNYILKLDETYYVENVDSLIHGKKVPIPIGHKNVIVVLNIDELNELKILLSFNENKRYKSISCAEINYSLHMN